MKKKYISNHLGILIIAVTIVLACSICIYTYNTCVFLSFTLGDALTLLTAIVIGYYLVENRNDERELGKEVLKIIENIQIELIKRDYVHINPKQNRSVVLNNNRWLNNQIYVLERISEKITRIKKYTQKIRETYNEYENVISDNMDQDKVYFNQPDRCRKQRKRLEIIQFNLQQMMLAVYDIPDINLKK